MMMSEIAACVYSSPDRERAEDVADELKQVGIVADFVPSERRIRTWDVEVPVDDSASAPNIRSGRTS